MTGPKSVFDPLEKTGSIPKERQTMIDLLVIKDLVGGTNEVVPAIHMVADILTIDMPLTEVFNSFLFALPQEAPQEGERKHRLQLVALCKVQISGRPCARVKDQINLFVWEDVDM